MLIYHCARLSQTFLGRPTLSRGTGDPFFTSEISIVGQQTRLPPRSPPPCGAYRATGISKINNHPFCPIKKVRITRGGGDFQALPASKSARRDAATDRPFCAPSNTNVGRRGRGYRISPLATHSLPGPRYFFPPRPGQSLRPPFDLAHDRARRRRNSPGISPSPDAGPNGETRKERKRPMRESGDVGGRETTEGRGASSRPSSSAPAGRPREEGRTPFPSRFPRFIGFDRLPLISFASLFSVPPPFSPQIAVLSLPPYLRLSTNSLDCPSC